MQDVTARNLNMKWVWDYYTHFFGLALLWMNESIVYDKNKSYGDFQEN